MKSLPDFPKLPPEALLGARSVATLCGMSPAVLDRRIKAGAFPPPVYHGRNRLWAYGTVVEWLRSLNSQSGGR